ncbi:hypothetical protein DFH09DRAFT_1322877 [Mycena vulgaris]|nr:hypothetical protein DFH09DRAFT_1322877 [Mycena vulgaris]
MPGHSSYRKLLWKHIHCRLEVLADSMIAEFHFNPSSVKNDEKSRIKASLALRHKIALPFAARGNNTRGADTGFRAALENELKVLATTKGSDRSSPAWLAYKTLVQADLALHRADDSSIGNDGGSDQEENGGDLSGNGGDGETNGNGDYGDTNGDADGPANS